MLFNSIDFAVFLPIVFGLYWFVFSRWLRAQNFLIVAASYVFYGWWDWRFLSLIAFSTLVDYLVGIGLSHTINERRRRLLLWTSILVNLGFLGFFKYYNFFLENFIEAFSFFGLNFSAGSLKIILPVGISFYTFQTLSYSIDVYRKKLEPTKDLVAFAAFVSFFPQLVAGPIERATNLLPQFYRKRPFDYVNAVDGCRQILWGLFKKIVIADNCAQYVNAIFQDHSSYSGTTLLLGGILFAFQIYGDFSGYSDIAIGTSRLFGFSLMKNFAFPYFSRDIAEFWRRWHISLSTWFRDYVYIPLGGSKVSISKQIRNVFIIFLVSGFWHGANWTFIVWGALNALYFLPLLLLRRNRIYLEVVAKGQLIPTFREVMSMLTTFLVTVIAWIFFRAESVGMAWDYLIQMTTNPFTGNRVDLPLYLIVCIMSFLLVEWLGREKEFALRQVNFIPKPIRWGMYFGIIALIFIYGGQEQEFIYFQF